MVDNTGGQRYDSIQQYRYHESKLKCILMAKPKLKKVKKADLGSGTQAHSGSVTQAQ